MLSPMRALLLTLLTALPLAASPALGAALAAADQNGGYAGKVLERVTQVWAPPPALKGDFEVRLKVELDGRGKVLNCTPTKGSGMEALDGSACGAVRQIGAFGTPPYGMPLEVHLAFWTGVPKGKAKTRTLSTEEAMRAEVMARTRAEGIRGEQQASTVEERAKERAEAIAKSSGQPLPEVEAAPVAPPAPARAATAKAAPKKSAGAGLGVNSAATTPVKAPKEKSASRSVAAETEKPAAEERKAQPAPLPETKAETPTPKASASRATGLTDEEMRLDLSAAPSATPPRRESTAGESGAPSPAAVSPSAEEAKAQDKYDQRYRKYISRTAWNLRNAILIPAETPPGTYYATVRLIVEPTGAIKKSTLLESSGDKQLDKFVLQGIRRAGSVEPTPAGLGNTLDITFTLVRR